MKPLPGSGKRDEIGEKATQFVDIVFHLLRPHTVALFLPVEHDLRLAAVVSQEPCVVPPGHCIPLSQTSVARVLEEIGEIWIRELSHHAHRLVPIYTDDVPIRSMRIVPVPLETDLHLPLMIDYTDTPENDPLDVIEPLIVLFSDVAGCTEGDLFLNRKRIEVPIPLFLRRILAPFLDFSLGLVPFQSLGLVLWGPPASEGEILEVLGEQFDEPAEYGERSFDMGPLRFQWSMGGLRKVSYSKREGGENTRYFPLVVGGDVVGNLSVVPDAPGFELKFHESLVRVISWSIQRELELINELVVGEDRTGLPNHNPYRAVNRVLNEWSNASRYNEYLSLGLVKLQIEGLETGIDKWNDVERVDRSLWGEVEEILRKGDILVHCSMGNLALIFPRTSPEGADNALRRLRNLLEGKKLYFDGSSVRIRSAEYSVLCYPVDLPTEETVLEKCSHVFLPQ